jgi:hypothetical protein
MAGLVCLEKWKNGREVYEGREVVRSVGAGGDIIWTVGLLDSLQILLGKRDGCVACDYGARERRDWQCGAVLAIHCDHA